MSTDCKHDKFYCKAKVIKLTDEEDTEKVTGYTADIAIHCMQCGTKFQFIGLPGGFSLVQPMVNIDATEARMPIRPSDEPIQLQEGMIYN